MRFWREKGKEMSIRATGGSIDALMHLQIIFSIESLPKSNTSLLLVSPPLFTPLRLISSGFSNLSMFCSRPCPKVDSQVSVTNWISLPSISVPRFLSCTPSSCHASLVQIQIRYHLASIFSLLRVLYFLLLAESKCQQVPIACIHIFPFHIRSHTLFRPRS